MKDETKEILDKLDYIISRTEDDILVNDYGIEVENYITNLQDKVEWYENIEVNKTIDKFRLEHNKEIKRLNKENEDYKLRCEKASELIRFIAFNSERPLTVTELNKVYNILKGVGKE